MAMIKIYHVIESTPYPVFLGREGLEKIRRAIKEHRLISFLYMRRQDEETKFYRVEPYEIKNNKYLYAYCLEHGQIHSFLLDRIVPSSIEILPQKFTPRWPTKEPRL
jgi:predicted DNA-binding transcriptional regulator YafY